MTQLHTISPASDPATLPGWLHLQSAQRGHAVALRHKHLGRWEERSWHVVAEEVKRLAGGLAARGFGAGDRLVLLSYPRAEALLMSLAAQWLGGMALPIDPTQIDTKLLLILRSLNPAFVFAEGQQQVDLILELQTAPHLIIYADPRGLHAYDNPALLSYIAAGSTHAAIVNHIAQAAENAFVFHQIDDKGHVQYQILSHAELLEQGRALVDAERLSHREEALAARAFAAAAQARYLLAPWLLAGFCLNFPENTATRDIDRRELGPTFVVGTCDTYARLERLVADRLPATGSILRRVIDSALAPAGNPVIKTLGYWLVRRPLRDVIGFTRTRVSLLVGVELPQSSSRFFSTLGVAIRNWPDGATWQRSELTESAASPESALSHHAGFNRSHRAIA